MSLQINVTSSNLESFLNSSNSVTIQSPTLTSSSTLTLPATGGSSSQCLQTNGSGTTSWATTITGPTSDNTLNLGSSTNRFANIYSSKLLTYNNSTFSSGNISDVGETTVVNHITNASLNSGIGYTDAVFMKGNILIAQDAPGGNAPAVLYIFNMKSPYNIEQICAFNPQQMYAVADIDWNDNVLAYCGAQSQGSGVSNQSFLNLVSISNLSSPTTTWSFGQSIQFTNVRLNANIMSVSSPSIFSGSYVGGIFSNTGAITLFDITDITSPKTINTISRSSCWHDYYHQELVSIDNTTSNNFSIVQNYLTASPTISTITCYGGSPFRFQIKNGYAYVVGTLSSSNLIVVDISNFGTPVVKYSYNIGNYNPILDIIIVGDIAYLLTQSAVAVITIANPASITQLYTISISNVANSNNESWPKFQIQGRYLFVKPYTLPSQGYISVYDIGGIHTTNMEAGAIVSNQVDANSVVVKKNVDIVGSLVVNECAALNNKTSLSQLSNVSLVYLSITTNYTLTNSNMYVDYNGSTTATLTIPTATQTNAGKIYFITNSSSSTLNLSSSVYANGSAITSVASLNNISIISNGNGKWFVI
jgi:hypothetical protein